MLAGRREGVGNVMAASLGMTFAFLMAAPMINEVALGLLFALLGWTVALTYLAFGLGIVIVAGWVIGQLKLEGWLEPRVLKIHAGNVDLPETTATWPDRIRAGLDAVREIVGRVWYRIIAGIAAGALIHTCAPEELLASIMVKDAVAASGVEVRVSTVTDDAEIAGYGIASTPGIVVDGRVVHAGGLPKAADLARWIAA